MVWFNLTGKILCYLLANKVPHSVNGAVVFAGGRPKFDAQKGARSEVHLANVAQRGKLTVDEDVDADAQPRGDLLLLLLRSSTNSRLRTNRASSSQAHRPPKGRTPRTGARWSHEVAARADHSSVGKFEG